jgi:heme exporter protein A
VPFLRYNMLMLHTDDNLRLELNDLAAGYGARKVLPELTLTLRGGETLVVAGANGSGKSTLLRLICGLQRPTAGTITYIVGERRARPEEARDLVGWVAPDLQLYRELTALENLEFFAQVRGLRRTRAELEALLEGIGLGGRGDDLLAAYSSGMAQRLRYAYALLHYPPVLLLDEPTVTLDERGAALVEQVVAAQRERGITIIATNDPRELRFGDYVLRLGQ